MSNTSDTSSVLETARQAAADVGLDPTKLAQDVGSRIRDAAEAQKSAGAEKVMGVARAIRSVAGDLEDDSPQVARYVRSAASSLEGLTRDINDRSVDDLTQAVVDMARRSPGLFFAGSVLAGFALFRFLNSGQNGSSSSNRSNRSGQRMGMQSHQKSGYGAVSSRPAGTSSAGTSSPGTSSTGTSSAGTSSAGTSKAGTSSGGTSSEGGYGGGGQGATRPASSPSTSTPGNRGAS
ncbi:MAG: Late embryosis abundant protein [Hyphomicrobiales bacterium]|jgi:hypothetical protein|nr:Late embryosis abundant protein [Hyphomicrobiales bacterium]